MSNCKKQLKNPARKIDASNHKVTSGGSGKKKAAAERAKHAEAVRQAARQAILDKKEPSYRSQTQLVAATSGILAVAAATFKS